MSESTHLKIEGRVQGVGFRWFIRVAARRMGLAGWVRNRPDGSVEVAAAGDPASVSELRRLVQRGPDGALVTSVVDLEPVPQEDLEQPFAMRK